MAKRRADGRYQKRITIEKGVYKTVSAKSPKELKDKINEIYAKIGKGLNLAAEQDTFGEWLDLWLRNKKRNVSESRYDTIVSYSKHLEDLRDYQIQKIRTADIQDLINSLSFSHDTLVAIKGIVKGTLQLAIDNRVMDYNPAASVTIPKSTLKSTTEPRRALTDEERGWIEKTPHRAQTAAMIMMYAGLRRGEVLALMWNDVNLIDKTITVRQSVEFVKDKPRIKDGAKTEAGNRIVYIPDKLVDFLNSIERNSLYVCPNSKGQVMTKCQWRRLWDSYLKELNRVNGNFGNVYKFEEKYMITEKNGTKRLPKKYSPKQLPMVIPHFTPHWLRHTFITLLYFAGVDVLTAKEQAGHSDISTTMGIYTHLDKVHKKKEINKLNEYIG